MGIDRDLAVQVLEDLELAVTSLLAAGYSLRELSVRHIMLQVRFSCSISPTWHTIFIGEDSNT